MTASPTTSNVGTPAPATRGRIGLVVLGSIAFGFVLGLVLTLVVFAGGEESEITGSALLALGAGFLLLALASSRFTDQPQRWALAPGIAAALVGLAILLFAPGNRALGLAGWVWPVLLVLLSAGRSGAHAVRSTAGRVALCSTRRSSSFCSSRSGVPTRRLRRRRRATLLRPVGRIS